MNITRLSEPFEDCCGYCGFSKLLRYKVKLTKTTLYICTQCYEEQMEFKEEGKECTQK